MLTTLNICTGRRWRSPRRITAGLGCSLLSIFTGSAGLPAIDWYQLRPTRWLIRDLESPSSDRAWAELQRRIEANRLSSANRDRLIAYGLKTQADENSNYELLDQIETWALDGIMPAAQKAAYFDQIASYELRLRRRVLQGNPVPYELRRNGAHSPNFETRITREIRIDGLPAKRAAGGGFAYHGDPYWRPERGNLQCNELGHHTLEVTCTVSVYRRTSLWPASAPSSTETVYQRTLPLQATFEVVSASPVPFIDDPRLAEVLRRSIRPEDFHVGRVQEEGNKLIAPVKAGRLPVDVLFDVYVSLNGQEWFLGSVRHEAGLGGWGSVTRCMRAQVPPASRCDLILRSSERADHPEALLTKVWRGELVYRDVPITLGPYATTAPE